MCDLSHLEIENDRNILRRETAGGIQPQGLGFSGKSWRWGAPRRSFKSWKSSIGQEPSSHIWGRWTNLTNPRHFDVQNMSKPWLNWHVGLNHSKFQDEITHPPEILVASCGVQPMKNQSPISVWYNIITVHNTYNTYNTYDTYEWYIWMIHMNDTYYTYDTYDTYEWYILYILYI